MREEKKNSKMKLIEIKEDQGAIVANFELEDERFFGIIVYESDGEFCLQLINSDGEHTRPVTATQWYKIADKISKIHQQSEIIGLNISREKLRKAVETILIRIENDNQLKNVLLRESEKQRPVEEKRAIQLTDEERDEAVKLLESAELLNEITRLIRTRLVQEDRNALLVFFTMLSAKTKEPLNLRFSGETSTGKSAIIRAVARLFPPEMVVIRTALTRKALYYSNLGKKLEDGSKLIDFRGKVLILLEENNCKDFIEEFKPILSHDLEMLESEFTDTSGKEITARKIVIKGFPAYIGLVASRMTTEEDDSRTLLSTPEKKGEKFKDVHFFTSSEKAFPWRFNGVDDDEKKVWNAIRLLESYDNIIIPYAPIIAEKFPSDKPRTMRDFKKLLEMVQAVTLLFQKRREVVEINGRKYLVSHPVDFLIAVEVLKDALSDTLLNIERDVREFFEHLSRKPDIWTRDQLRNILGEFTGYVVKRETFRIRYLIPLLDAGLLEEDDSKKPYQYSISNKSLPSLPKLSKLAIELIKPKSKEFLRLKLLPEKSGNNTYINVTVEEVKRIVDACYSLTDNEKNMLYLPNFLGNLRQVFTDLKIDLEGFLNSEPCHGNHGNLSKAKENEEEKSNITEKDKNKEEDIQEIEGEVIDFTKLKECPCGYTTFSEEEYRNHTKNCPTYQFKQNKDGGGGLDDL